jgi:hypothetical protein
MAAPQSALENVFVKSSGIEQFTEQVSGFDFESVRKNNYQVDYDALLKSYRTTGYQATNFGLAVEEIEKMVGRHFFSFFRCLAFFCADHVHYCLFHFSSVIIRSNGDCLMNPLIRMKPTSSKVKDRQNLFRQLSFSATLFRHNCCSH